MTATPERLDAITARLDAATPGPWKVRECPPCTERGRLEVNIWDEPGNLLITNWCDDDEFHRPDAEFIANAPADVAYLLDLARKQAAALEAVRELADSPDQTLVKPKGDKVFYVEACRIRTALEATP